VKLRLSRRTLVLACAALCMAGSANAAAYSVATPNYSVIGRDADTIVKLATRLEVVRGLLESQVGRIPAVEADKQLTFLVVGDTDQVVRLCRPGCSMETIGFAHATARGPVAVIPKNAVGNGSFDVQYVLYGIAARDAIARKFPKGAPEWLRAGWAEMVASTDFARPGKLPLGIVQVFRRLQSRQLRWSNLVEVLDGTATSEKDDRLSGQAMMLTHYLLFSPARRGQLGAYTAAIMAGKSGAEATNVFGDLGKLADELRAYDDLNGLLVRTLPAPPPPRSLSAHPIADSDLASVEEAVRQAGR
jgi:hypothetical protein